LIRSLFWPASRWFVLGQGLLHEVFQLPLSFNLSAFGPGVALFLEWFELSTAFFFLNQNRYSPQSDSWRTTAIALKVPDRMPDLYPGHAKEISRLARTGADYSSLRSAE
jgi:hypothetical protein